MDEQQKEQKIQALREMIYNAEKTLSGAKAILLQLEGKKKVGRKKKQEDTGEGRIVEGTFDGQIMIGADGKQYPIPANYASKSKLVEGDMLKLTITPDGSFIYKQIGPVERKRVIGIANQDSAGNYFVTCEGKAYKILLASVTYFKVEPGDEVTLVVPRDIDSDWGSIENVLERAKEADIKPIENENGESETDGNEDEEEEEEEILNNNSQNEKQTNKNVVDEWAPDLEELKKELNQIKTEN